MGNGCISKSFRDMGSDIKPLSEDLLGCLNNGQLRTAKRLVEKLSKRERTAVSRVIHNRGWTLLFDASYYGDTSFVNFFLDECYADIEQCCDYNGDVDMMTPLCCAALEGRLATVKTLVEHGAHLNYVAGTCVTPATAACIGKNIHVVRYLVENGADINQPGKFGRTCLMLSVRNVELCRFLLGQNASVSAVDDEGNSALHRAVEVGCFDCVKLLMEHGANPSTENSEGHDAMAVAVGHLNDSSTTKILEYLVQEMEPKTPCVRYADMFALLAAVATFDDNHSVDEALHFWTKSIEIRVDKNFVGDPSKAASVRQNAAYNFPVEVADIESLTNIAEDTDAMSMQALVVLDRVVGPEHPIMFTTLSQCANQYIVLGAHQRYIDLAMYTLRNCANLTQTDSGIRCIHWIAEIYCAFVNLIDDNPASIHFANVYNVLEWTVGNIGTMMSSLAPNEQEQILYMAIYLIDAMCCLTLTDVERSSFEQLVRALVQAGLRTSDGRTPLHLAVAKMRITLWNGDTKITISLYYSTHAVECLLAAGAAVDAADLAGNTALHGAAFSSPTEEQELTTEDWKKKKKVIELLISHGAHVDIANARREFASDWLPADVAFKHLTLKCLAARAVRDYQLPYRGTVPATLADFTDRH